MSTQRSCAWEDENMEFAQRLILEEDEVEYHIGDDDDDGDKDYEWDND